MAPSTSRIAYPLLALLLATNVTSAPNRPSEHELNALISTLECVREVLPAHARCMGTGGWHQSGLTMEDLTNSVSFALWDPSCPDHTPVDNLNDAYAQAEWAIDQCSQHQMDGGIDLRRVKGRADETTTTSRATTSSAPKPSECYTTSMHSITTCPIIATGVHSGRVGSCFPTTIPTSVCAEGLLCNSDADGNPSCMYAQNNLGVAGVIMAIFFAATVGVTASLICFFSRREKRNNKKWEKIMEAETIARETASARAAAHVQEVGAGREGQEDGRPLMGDANGAYGQDPFRDDQRMR